MEIAQAITLTLDTQPPFYQLKMRQGDSSRQIIASIYENTVAWEIPEGTTIEFRAKKPDETKVVRSEGITFLGNTVTVPLTSNTLAVPGKVACELVFSDAAGGVLGTANFILEVWADVVPMSDIESQDDYQSLTQAVADAQQAAGNAQQSETNAQQSAQAASQSASEAAQSAQQAAESVASIGDSVEQAAASASAAQTSADAAAESAQQAAASAAEVETKIGKFKGVYPDLSSLQEANPTPQDGDWAVLEDSKTVWVYNGTLSLWEEGGNGYNYLLNAGFLINQRGKESYSSSGLGLDMWFNNFDTGNVNMTLTTEEVDGQSERAVVITCDTVTGTSGGVPLFFQQIENVNGKSLVAGKKITLSFYYKTDADYRTLFIAYKPAGSGDFTILQKPISASPDEYTQAYYTVDIPEGATNVQFGAGSSRALTSGDNGTVMRITRPQVVEGNSPLRWETADMSVDLMKCQRFYERINNCWGNAVSSTLLWLSMPFKVEKAAAPTIQYGFGDMPNVVQTHLTTGIENLPLAAGALTADTQGVYFNGGVMSGGSVANNVGVWACYVEAEAPLT